MATRIVAKEVPDVRQFSFVSLGVSESQNVYTEKLQRLHDRTSLLLLLFWTEELADCGALLPSLLFLLCTGSGPAICAGTNSDSRATALA